MEVTEVVGLALLAGIVLGLIVRRGVAFLIPLALSLVPAAWILSDRGAFSQDDTTATLLEMCVLFLLAPMLIGTSLGIGLGRRVKPPQLRARDRD